MKINIYKIISKILIIALVIFGIFLPSQHNEAGEQFWFFTIQTNLFVAIIQIILLISLILKLSGKQTKLEDSNLFSKIRIIITFFITVTCLIYCFVLAPAGMIFKSIPFLEMFDFRNIILHIIVPVLAIVDYILFCKKGSITFKQTYLFLIYPVLYFFLVNTRVWCGGLPFSESGSYYPYFFLDPAINGWGFVAICLVLIVLLFYGLASLYIYIDKKILKKQLKENLAQQKKPE